MMATVHMSAVRVAARTTLLQRQEGEMLMYQTGSAAMWSTVRVAIVGWPQTVRLIVITIVITICILAALIIH